MRNHEALQQRIDILENNIRLAPDDTPYWRMYGWQKELATLRSEMDRTERDSAIENIEEELERFKDI